MDAAALCLFKTEDILQWQMRQIKARRARNPYPATGSTVPQKNRGFVSLGFLREANALPQLILIQ